MRQTGQSQAASGAADDVADIQQALAAPAVIEQATGKLAERHRETTEAAKQRLHGYADQHDLDVRDLAERVLRDEFDA